MPVQLHPILAGKRIQGSGRMVKIRGAAVPVPQLVWF